MFMHKCLYKSKICVSVVGEVFKFFFLVIQNIMNLLLYENAINGFFCFDIWLRKPLSQDYYADLIHLNRTNIQSFSFNSYSVSESLIYKLN